MNKDSITGTPEVCDHPHQPGQKDACDRHRKLRSDSGAVWRFPLPGEEPYTFGGNELRKESIPQHVPFPKDGGGVIWRHSPPEERAAQFGGHNESYDLCHGYMKKKIKPRKDYKQPAGDKYEHKDFWGYE